MSEYLDELKTVIKDLYGVDATYVETVPVKEVFQGETMWDGEVEVFDVPDLAEADRVYAWAYDDDAGEKRPVTVLHIPPATSPENAVRASIISEYGKGS